MSSFSSTHDSSIVRLLNVSVLFVMAFFFMVCFCRASSLSLSSSSSISSREHYYKNDHHSMRPHQTCSQGNENKQDIPSSSFLPSPNTCSLSTTYPSLGCEKENPSGDAMLFTGHYSAVQGRPDSVYEYGQYSFSSIDRKANGGQRVYERPYGLYNTGTSNPLVPAVTET